MLSHVTCVFEHVRVLCLCNVDICTLCCSVAGGGKHEGTAQSEGVRLPEGSAWVTIGFPRGLMLYSNVYVFVYYVKFLLQP